MSIMANNRKMTKTIATLLAEKIYLRIKKESLNIKDKLTATVEKSKEFNQYKKLCQQRSEIESKQKTLREVIENKYSTSIAKVTVTISASPSILISNTQEASIQGISERLLFEDYFNGAKENPDEIIDRLVKEYLTIK